MFGIFCQCETSIKDSNGKYLGFLMPAIDNSKQLSSICNPKRRNKVAPGFNWYYLHVTALNTAWIIQSIHAKGYVLGDIKLENILVNDRAMTAVIDTDSFQVRDSQSNQVYRCTVGSEGFTPPELLGKDFDTTNQTEIHDRFRLGVLIHYLLFGYHPFSGNWTGVRESPEQTELIKQGYWYAAHNSPIRASKTTIPFDVVYPELEKLFLKCFNEGHTKPHLRPTALDWHNGLEVAVNQLTSCSRVDSHHYSKTYGKCYWCDRAATLGVDIFPGGVDIATIPSQRTSSASKDFQRSNLRIFGSLAISCCFIGMIVFLFINSHLEAKRERKEHEELLSSLGFPKEKPILAEFSQKQYTSYYPEGENLSTPNLVEITLKDKLFLVRKPNPLPGEITFNDFRIIEWQSNSFEAINAFAHELPTIYCNIYFQEINCTNDRRGDGYIESKFNVCDPNTCEIPNKRLLRKGK